MDFPSDNKIHTDIQSEIESNAKALEEMAKRVDWRYLLKAYWFVLVNLVAGIGLIIAVIKLALKI